MNAFDQFLKVAEVRREVGVEVDNYVAVTLLEGSFVVSSELSQCNCDQEVLLSISEWHRQRWLHLWIYDRHNFRNAGQRAP